MTVFVADIASYQAGLIPADLKPACVGLWLKCTQGSGYVNPYYAAWLAEAKAANLITAAYHYVDGSSPQAQAANLKAHIGDTTLPVMIDEESVGLQQALETADAMTGLGLNVRLMYLSKSYWQSLGAPDLSAPFASRGLHLIEASYRSMNAGTTGQLYPGDTAAEWNPYGGVTPALLQFTATDELAGQLLDCNAYRGTADQLKTLLGIATTPTAPKPPTVTAATSEEDDMQQIEPITVHPSEYAYGVPAGKTKMQLACDGYGAVAELRIAVWGSGADVLTVKLGGKTGTPADHQRIIDLPAGSYQVTVRREDGGDFPVSVMFE